MLEDINNASPASEKDVILLNLITFLEASDASDAVDDEHGLGRVKETHHVDSHHHKESPNRKGRDVLREEVTRHMPPSSDQ